MVALTGLGVAGQLVGLRRLLGLASPLLLVGLLGEPRLLRRPWLLARVEYPDDERLLEGFGASRCFCRVLPSGRPRGTRRLLALHWRPRSSRWLTAGRRSPSRGWKRTRAARAQPQRAQPARGHRPTGRPGPLSARSPVARGRCELLRPAGSSRGRRGGKGEEGRAPDGLFLPPGHLFLWC